MQAAVDAVQSSPHPTNKIAATLAGVNANAAPFAITRTNHWPVAIKNAFGQNTAIGNSSGTVHAETACILDAPKLGYRTQNASLFITDPPCPNCMKNIAEAGITALYIDHKGFDKDWSARRGDSFKTMSMRIAAKAGIDVYALYRKEQRFEVISQHAQGYKPAQENLATITPTDDSFAILIQNAQHTYKEKAFSLAIATNQKEERTSILVNPHPAVGYTYETVEDKSDKYSFILQPLNRLLMIAAREGLQLDPNHIHSSRVPTSRELVNFIAAGFSQIQIADTKKARDEFGPLALEQLVNAGILKLTQ